MQYISYLQVTKKKYGSHKPKQENRTWDQSKQVSW